MKKSTPAIGRSQKHENLSVLFRENRGYARTQDLRNVGVHQRDIKKMLDDGLLIKVKNGLFRHSGAELISNQGFIDISVSVPEGVICLVSALSYYELTTFNPSFISVALARNTWKPKIEYPPVEFVYFSGQQFEAGIEYVSIDNFNVRIYSPEKTICDCFRLRHKLGLDIAKEALKEYLKWKNRDLEKILHYSQICRVKQFIDTWLNALV